MSRCGPAKTLFSHAEVGMTLIEVMIALGIMAMGSLAFLNMINFQLKAQKNVEMKSTFHLTADNARLIYSSPTDCLLSLGGQVFDPAVAAGSPVIVKMPRTTGILVQEGQVVPPGLQYTAIRIVPTTPADPGTALGATGVTRYLANFYMEAKKPSTLFLGSPQVSENLLMSFDVKDSDKKIQACGAMSSVSSVIHGKRRFSSDWQGMGTSFTVPDGVTQLYVSGVGGGGGGAGGSDSQGGGGGGGGESIIAQLLTVTSGSVITVTIGIGGAGGAQLGGGSQGVSGTKSSLATPGIFDLFSALPGDPGGIPIFGRSTHDQPGQSGNRAIGIRSNFGHYGVGDVGGDGAATVFGPGGNGGYNLPGTDGSQGYGPGDFGGGGGGGAKGGSAGTLGGRGADGMILIEW